MGKFSLKGIGDNKAELGVSAGSERYDAAKGVLSNVAVVDLDELDEAITAARKEGKAADKSNRDYPFAPHIDPQHPSADSSFRSEDRPPIYISSETNPTPENPTPVTVAEGGPVGIDRLPSGLADVPGNSQFDLAPGPNVVTPPEGVAQPTPIAPKVELPKPDDVPVATLPKPATRKGARAQATATAKA